MTFHKVNRTLWKDFEEGKIPLNTLGRKRFEILSAQLSIKVDVEHIADIYERSLGSTTEWLPDALETLNILKQKFTLGIITNGFSKVQRIKYQNLSLDHWCSCYVISEEVGYFKPDKEIFDIALSKIGYQSNEVLMVGDSITSDFKGSLNANIDFCLVSLYKQELPEDLPKPKYIVNSVLELISILNLKNNKI